MKMVSEAPACAITNIDFSEDYNPPHELLYKVEMTAIEDSDKKGDAYELETGDLIALTDVKPACINDLDNPGNSFLIALVKRIGENCAKCFSSEKYIIDVSTLGAVIRSFDMNKSQEDAVFSSIAARECSHKNIVKLVLGPPGTGKTKTVSSLLFSLFKKKCRTLTCTPTNVAVLEATSRFLGLVMESLEYHTYGLGDIVLFGNGEGMKIDTRDDLLEVFLDYRANILSKCFAPLSGGNIN